MLKPEKRQNSQAREKIPGNPKDFRNPRNFPGFSEVENPGKRDTLGLGDHSCLLLLPTCVNFLRYGELVLLLQLL